MLGRLGSVGEPLVRSSTVIEVVDSSKRHSEPGVSVIVRDAEIVVDWVGRDGVLDWRGSRPGRKSIAEYEGAGQVG